MPDAVHGRMVRPANNETVSRDGKGPLASGVARPRELARRPGLEMMRQGATLAGVRLSVQPEYVGGFLRLKSGLHVASR